MLSYHRAAFGSVLVFVAGWNVYLNCKELQYFRLDSSHFNRTTVSTSLSTGTTYISNAIGFDSYDDTKNDSVTKALIPQTSSPPDFRCPSNLFETWKLVEEVDEYDIHPNVTRFKDNSVGGTPKIVLMRLPKEEKSFYVNRTEKSLVQNNYSFCVADSIYGVELLGEKSTPAKTKDVFGLNFSSDGSGSIGCWMSHLTVWYLGLKYNTPIISLESDTKAVMKWTIDKNVYKDYDILYLHSHKNLRRRCQRNQPHVLEGKDYWFATGAMLFTNNDPVKVKRVFQEELRDKQIKKPIGHWLNDMYSAKKLRIGSLCPLNFAQVQDHPSTI